MKQGKLFILGQEIELLWHDMNYHRDIRMNGKAASDVFGGLIKVCYATDKDTDLILRWMTKENMDNTWNEVDKMEKGKVCFYENGFDYPPTKTYEFNDAHLIYFEEIFNAEGENPMQTILTISPAIQNYGENFVKRWNNSWIPPSERTSYQPMEQEQDEKLKIVSLEGPFDIETGEKATKGISRFKDYQYIVEFNKPINNSFDVYWGQSLDDQTDIKALLNSQGRNLRGGSRIGNNNKKLRVKLRFGEGAEKFKLHAYLNNRYYESTSIEIFYNKIVGVVVGVNKNTGDHYINLFEVTDTAYIEENLIVKDITEDLGGKGNDAYSIFYTIKDPAGITLDGIGGLGTGMKAQGGSFSIKNSKGLKPKYYQPKYSHKGGFRGNQFAKTYQLTKVGRVLGRAGTAGTIIIGVVDVYYSYQEDGDKLGTETQKAGGRLAGSLGGAALGAYIGVHFFGIGAIPGAIIGSIIGGYFGSELGEDAVEAFQELKETPKKLP